MSSLPNLSVNDIYKAVVKKQDPYTKLSDLISGAQSFNDGEHEMDVIQQYLQMSGRCQEIFELIRDLPNSSAKDASILFNISALILIRTANDLKHFSNVGYSFVTELLNFGYKNIISFLKPTQKSSSMKLVLRLLFAMIMQGPQAARDVFIKIDFSGNYFIQLFGKTSIQEDDVRSSYISVISLLLTTGDDNLIRNAVETKGFLNGVFPGLPHDHASSIILILETFLSKIVNNISITKTIKIRLFNDHTLKHIVKLYDWKGSVRRKGMKRKLGDDSDFYVKTTDPKTIASVHSIAHKFMLEICCSHKNGIIFQDNIISVLTRNPNHLITNILTTVPKPHLNSLMSELVVAIIKTCPDQIKYFLPSLKDSFYPRLSLPWIKAISLLKKIFEAQNFVCYLFESKEKRPIDKIIAVTEALIFPNVIDVSSYVQCYKAEHPVIGYYLSSYLCVILHHVKELFNYCANNVENTVYTPAELETFKNGLQALSKKHLPICSCFQEYWNRLVSNENFESEEILSIAEEMEIPNIKQQLLQILEVLKLYHQVLPISCKEFSDMYRAIFYELQKLKEHDRAFLNLQLEVADFLLTYSRLEDLLLTTQDENKSPFGIMLSSFTTTEDLRIRAKIANVIFKILQNICPFDAYKWEFRLWLKYLIAQNKKQRKITVNFFEDVLKCFAKQDNLSDEKNKSMEISACSPLLSAALNCFNSSYSNFPIIQNYMELILQDIIHRQFDPKSLFDVTKIYHHLFRGEIINYWKMLSCFKMKPHDWKEYEQLLLVEPSSCSDILKNVLIVTGLNKYKELRNIDTFKELLANTKIEDIIGIESLVWQILMYIELESSLIFEPSSCVNESSIEFYSSALIDLLEKSKFILLDHELSLDSTFPQRSVVEAVLSHPTIIKCFLFVANPNIDSSMHKSILSPTYVLFHIFSEFKIDLYEKEFLPPLKEKVVPFYNSYLQLLKENQTCMPFLWEIFKTLMKKYSFLLTCESAINSLKTILNPDIFKHFQTLDPKFQLILKLTDIYCEGKGYFVLDCNSGRSLLHTVLHQKKHKLKLKFLQKYPIYALTLECGDANLILEQMNNTNLEIFDNLLLHNVALRNSIVDIIVLGKLDTWNDEVILHLINKCCESASIVEREVLESFGLMCNIFWGKVLGVLKYSQLSLDHVTIDIHNVILFVNNHNLLNTDKIHEIQKLILHESKHSLPSESKLKIIMQIINSWMKYCSSKTIFKIFMNWFNLIFSSVEVPSTLPLFKFAFDTLKEFESNVIQKYFSPSFDWKNFALNFLKFSLKNVNAKGGVGLNLLECIYEKLYKSKKEEIQVKEEIKYIHSLIISHSNFFPVMLNEISDSKYLKDPILSLLCTLVKLNPDLCRDNHIPLFLAAYSCSMNTEDQKLLYLIKLYEEGGIDMLKFSPFMWGGPAIVHYSLYKDVTFLWKQPKMQEILGLFDKDLLFFSALNFPLDLKMQVNGVVELESHLCKMYDPRFVLHLASVLLSPGAYVHCRTFIESGVLSLVFRSLSSEDPPMRALGYYCLSQLHSHLESSMSKQCQTWIALLDSIRYSIDKPNLRLPSVVTVFLAKVISILINPENSLYTPIYKFLIAKPNLELMQVPEFYKFFNSIDIEHRIQRNWILSLLADGIKNSLDFHLCKKRYLFTILLPFYTSPISNDSEKVKILQIILASVKIPSSARFLWQAGLLTWLYNVIRSSISDENIIINYLNDILYTLWTTTSENISKESNSSEINETDLQNTDVQSTVEQSKEPFAKSKISASLLNEFLLVYLALLPKLSLLHSSGLRNCLKVLLTLMKNSFCVNNMEDKQLSESCMYLTLSDVHTLVKVWQKIHALEPFSETLQGEGGQSIVKICNEENECSIHEYFSKIVIHWTPLWKQSSNDKQYEAMVSLCFTAIYLTFQSLPIKSSHMNNFSHWLRTSLDSDDKNGLVNLLISIDNDKSLSCIQTMLKLYEMESIAKMQQNEVISAWGEVCIKLKQSDYVTHQLSSLHSILESHS